MHAWRGQFEWSVRTGHRPVFRLQAMPRRRPAVHVEIGSSDEKPCKETWRTRPSRDAHDPALIIDAMDWLSTRLTEATTTYWSKTSRLAVALDVTGCVVQRLVGMQAQPSHTVSRT